MFACFTLYSLDLFMNILHHDNYLKQVDQCSRKKDYINKYVTLYIA